MKRLILMRHAQAQLERFGFNDRERAITMAGMHELDAIRVKIQGHLEGISLILCSNAKRTRQTLEGMKPLVPSTASIVYKDELYHTNSRILWDRLSEVEDTHQCIMILAHNPGLTQFIQELEPSIPFKEFPTSGVAICEGEFPSWQAASPRHLKLHKLLTV
ncbi:MAG: hypothetical protein K2W94_01135 [Alphaproteobacteria bacterium]|nr:hypothetical protein [Alphaproteobacteria bacterium]